MVRSSSVPPHPSSRLAADGGFSLVEVLAAVVLFVAISASTITVLLMALKTVRENNDRVLVANVARSQIEELRVLGPDQIVPGLTYDKPAGTPDDFVVETSAQWVGAGQTASACDAASPGQAYLRIRVAASSPDLGAPAVADTIIAPEANVSDEGTAAIAINVEDHNGEPVSGVTVTAVDSTSPENSFTYLTGSDGCLYIPGLTPDRALAITVSKDGYVSNSESGDTTTSNLDAGSLAKPSLLLAPASGIDFISEQSDYPLPVGTPISWRVNETGALVNSGQTGVAVVGQWPNPSGFAAWAGCADADPGDLVQTFDFTAGGSTVAGVSAGRVELSGLPPGVDVIASPTGVCSDQGTLTVRSDVDGIVRLSLPYGLWSFSASVEREIVDGEGETVTETLSEDVTLSEPLDPAQADSTPVEFTLADQVEPPPSEFPEPSSSESPGPSLSPKASP
ncbi:MAG: hypothetical protein VXZ03_03660 [Actinomycetota bacterium]|nr:hypothetical protein [Actinomycetota bacterium]